tara:strand:+ start:1544 stop:2371 length:828 start_codon:yes stop_codon:yes gene_type:complete
MFTFLQRLIPQHFLSRLFGKAAISRNIPLKNFLIAAFSRAYDISLKKAKGKAQKDYATFNDFFTRELESKYIQYPDLREQIGSPAEGVVSQFGDIQDTELIQAKNHRYRITELAGDLANGFEYGKFLTIYLAPHNYHRVHLPLDATLTNSIAFPGALFSVNNKTAQNIKGLFVRNERLVCKFESEFGQFLLVFVGALLVSSIKIVWGEPTSPYKFKIQSDHDIQMSRGEEIGHFLMGSTVICCFERGSFHFDPALKTGMDLTIGAPIGLAHDQSA